MSLVNRLSRQYTGYTLVELLISLFVIAVLTAVGTISYRDFTRRQQVVGAARQVIADLRLAQNEALAGKKAGCSGTLERYDVAIDTSVGSLVVGSSPPRYRRYITQVVCTAPASTTLVRTSTLPNNTSINSFTTISFRAIGLGTTMAAGGSTTINVAGDGTSYNQNVIVNASGDIR